MTKSTKMTPRILITDLKQNPINPRYITPGGLERLIKKLLRVPEGLSKRGFIVDTKGNNVLDAGNQRHKAVQEIASWTYEKLSEEIDKLDISKSRKAASLKTWSDVIASGSIPQDWVDDLAGWHPEARKEFILIDNTNDGEWDWEMYDAHFGEAYDWIDIERDDSDVVEEPPEAKDDHYNPTDQTKIFIEEGDVIEIGEHRLLCGDATEPAAWERLMQTEKADAIVTDPPYNVDYTGKTKDALKIKGDKQSDSAFFDFLLRSFEMNPEHSRPGAAWYVWHADSEGHNFRNALTSAGIQIRQCLVWVKDVFVMGRQDYQWKHEPCLYGWTPGAAHYFIPERTHDTILKPYEGKDITKMKKDELVQLLQKIFELPGTILEFDRRKRNAEHPTMKPVLLIGESIKNSTRPGDTVLDSFIGSGTTMVACHQLNRVCYGMELDPKNCQVIIERMTLLDPEISVKINGEPYEHQ